MRQSPAQPGERARNGFVLLATAAGLIAMVGALGLSVDLARLYIARNEAQTYVDAAALAAALELDGTAAGITLARNRALALPNRWHLGTVGFSGTQVDFATSAAGPWVAAPSPADNYRFVRVQAGATASLYFIPVVTGQMSGTVRAQAVAAQVPKTSFNEGILPFSPMAHDPADPNFGFTPGQRYTLRWGANPKVGPNVCPGDNQDIWVNLAEAGNASERGYIEETSSAVIRMAIEQNYQSRPLAVGDTVTMTGGNKQTQRDSLINRVNQDTDNVSASYAEYVANDTGNGRRLVVVPVNTWYPDYRVVGFAAFFLLLPSQYPQAGNKSFCAEYVGPFVQGSRRKGAGGSGAYVVRLVQ